MAHGEMREHNFHPRGNPQSPTSNELAEVLFFYFTIIKVHGNLRYHLQPLSSRAKKSSRATYANDRRSRVFLVTTSMHFVLELVDKEQGSYYIYCRSCSRLSVHDRKMIFNAFILFFISLNSCLTAKNGFRFTI